MLQQRHIMLLIGGRCYMISYHGLRPTSTSQNKAKLIVVKKLSRQYYNAVPAYAEKFLFIAQSL